MTTCKLYVNPNFLFYLKDGEIIAVNSYTKEEFTLEDRYWQRIKFWSGENADALNEMDDLLLSGGVVQKDCQQTHDWGGDRLSYFFFRASHNAPENTPYRGNIETCDFLLDYASGCGRALPSYKVPRGIIDTISLPPPHFEQFDDISYGSVLQNRKTSRHFDGSSISVQVLSDLLFVGFGYIHGKAWPEFQSSPFKELWRRKSSPSATGSQAIEVYIIITHVRGLASGVYKYDPEEHQLWLLQESFDDNKLAYAVNDQFWVKGSACSFFLVANLERGWFKDPTARVLSNAYLEAGHISQTLLLTATALGLSTWLSAVMREYYLQPIMQISGNQQLLTSVVSVGYGANTAIPILVSERVPQQPKTTAKS